MVTCQASRYHVDLGGVRLKHSIQSLFGTGVRSKIDGSGGGDRVQGLNRGNYTAQESISSPSLVGNPLSCQGTYDKQ